MTDRTRQRLRDFEMLLSNHPEGLSASEIAAELNVTRQTVYNDLERLSLDGVPVFEEKGRYFLDPSYRPAIRLSLAQAWMMYLPLRRLVRAELHRMPLVRSLLYQITSLLHQEIADQLFPTPTEGQVNERDRVFSQLVDCWRTQQHVELRYQRPNADRASTLVVAPWWFEPAVWSDAFYLICGFKRASGEVEPLTLKLDRILSVRPLNTHFERPSGREISEYLEHTWGIWVGEQRPVQVKLRFHNRQYQRLQETHWHPTQELWLEGDGSVIWQAQISEPQEMLPWIRGWGADVEVLEPDDLRQQIAAEAEATARIYQPSAQESDSYIF